MKRRLVVVAGALYACLASAQMPSVDDLMKGVRSLPKAPAGGAGVGAGDDKTNAAGIKEALAVGTERAVRSLSQVDGYFGNAAVKILMPSSIQKVAEVARKAEDQDRFLEAYAIDALPI
jgi:hypothetical protein